MRLGRLGRGRRGGPGSWISIFDRTGRCYYAVPPDWRTEDSSSSAESIASSPDGRASATLHWVHKSLISVAADLKSDRRTVVHEYSLQRLWAEYFAGWTGRHYLVATRANDGACVLYVDVIDQKDDEIQKVVSQIFATADAIR